MMIERSQELFGRMIFALPLFFLVPLFLSACAPNGEDGNDEPDIISSSSSSIVSSSSSQKEDVKPPLTLSSLAPYLTEWTSIWSAMIPGFTVESMHKTSTKEMKAQISDALVNHEDILARQKELDYPILFPSNDGKTLIYISSGEEPDSEVSIIRPDLNLYERHLFCGTPCGFDSAVWVDDDHVIITGFSEYYPPNGEPRCSEGTICTFVPVLYLFDLGAKTITRYEGAEVEAAIFLNMGVE